MEDITTKIPPMQFDNLDDLLAEYGEAIHGVTVAFTAAACVSNLITLDKEHVQAFGDKLVQTSTRNVSDGYNLMLHKAIDVVKEACEQLKTESRNGSEGEPSQDASAQAGGKK